MQGELLGSALRGFGDGETSERGVEEPGLATTPLPLELSLADSDDERSKPPAVPILSESGPDELDLVGGDLEGFLEVAEDLFLRSSIERVIITRPLENEIPLSSSSSSSSPPFWSRSLASCSSCFRSFFAVVSTVRESCPNSDGAGSIGTGVCLGRSLSIQGCSRISSIEILFDGSTVKSFLNKSLSIESCIHDGIT